MAVSASDQTAMQLQLDNLEKIIASGVKRAKVNDRDTEFRSITEIYAIRDDLRTRLGLNTGAGRQVRRTVTSYRGGF